MTKHNTHSIWTETLYRNDIANIGIFSSLLFTNYPSFHREFLRNSETCVISFAFAKTSKKRAETGITFLSNGKTNIFFLISQQIKQFKNNHVRLIVINWSIYINRYYEMKWSTYRATIAQTNLMFLSFRIIKQAWCESSYAAGILHSQEWLNWKRKHSVMLVKWFNWGSLLV